MAHAKGMSVGKRINRIAIIAGACFLCCMIVELVCIEIVSNSFTNFINNEYEVVSKRGDITLGNQGTGRSLCKMILSSLDDDQAGVETYYDESKSYFVTMEDGLEKLYESDSNLVDKTIIEEALNKEADFTAIIEELHDLCVAGKGMEAWQLYLSDYSSEIEQLRNSLNDILETADNSAEAHIRQDTNLSRGINIFAIVTTIGMVVLLYSLTKRTAKSITDPIVELEESSDHMRQGHLDFNIDYDEQDELGSLCRNVNATCHILSSYVNEIAGFADAINNGKLDYRSSVVFLGDFKAIGTSLVQLSQFLSNDMAKISSSADQVNRGAEQISAVSQQLSQSAVEQASSVQELATTITAVSDHVTDNAATALTVRDCANGLYDSMSQYSLLMKSVNKNMTDTRSMTDKVRGIVRNLETISFQTNLLALNAAVEAARAGDAGRGFAVIASEIRELASEASHASTNSSVLLSDMIDKVSTSADMTQKAIDSLDTILDDGNKTAVNMDKISKACNNQATAIAQIRQSISELSMNIQSISSTAEESAASSEELMSQMRLLNKMVDYYELRTSDDRKAQ